MSDTGKRWRVFGNAYVPGTKAKELITIPPGIYYYMTTMTGWQLQFERPCFEFPFEVYDFDADKVDRIMKTWDLKEGNLGVLLNGVKGTGKTVVAQRVCNQMIEAGYPVIVASSVIPLDAILDSLNQPVVILFDEFEKTHHKPEDQHSILSALDGVNRSVHKRMYLFVTNNPNMDDNMKDRPSRMWYHFNFSKLSREQIDMILQRKLDPALADMRESIVTWLLNRRVVTVDSVMSTVAEVNMHKESPSVFEDFFNLGHSAIVAYRVMISRDKTTWNELSGYWNPHEYEAQRLRQILNKDPRVMGWFAEGANPYNGNTRFYDSEYCVQITGYSDVPEICVGYVGVPLTKTWAKGIDRHQLADLPYPFLMMDQAPEGWTPPIGPGGISALSGTRTLTEEEIATLNKYWTDDRWASIHGTDKLTPFFLKFEPLYTYRQVHTVAWLEH